MSNTRLRMVRQPAASRNHHAPAIALVALVAIQLASVRAESQHDCVPYTPSMAEGSFDNTWSVPSEQDDYQFTVPSDPGGGYVTIEFSTTAPASPWMTVLVAGHPGSISSGGTNPPGGQQITVVFEVAPGQTYDIEVSEFLNAPIEDHPVSYQLSWTFTGKADCYEPNDGRDIWPDPQAVSKAIPLEQVIEAYSLAGHITNSIVSTHDNNYDWYDVTLAASTNISLATLKVPADQKLKLRLFNEAQSVVMESSNPVLGGTIQVGPTLLPAGTYYLETLPFDRGASSARPSAGEPVPDHFNTSYKLVVTAQPIPSCGYQAVFCDDFETGDSILWSSTNP